MMEDTGKADDIYRRKVAAEGLFAVAFFGASGSKAQKRRCNTLWRAARREARTKD
jgi:hypothetical protein